MSTIQTEATRSETVPTPAMRPPMRFRLAALIYMMVQGVSFGVLTVIVLSSPLKQWSEVLLPAVVVISLIASAYISWRLAPSLRARFERRASEDHLYTGTIATT